MPFGLFPTGFQRKRLENIKAEIEARLRATFGENIDLRPESVFGQFVGVEALAHAEEWEQMEAIYLSQDPDFAEGIQLDALAALTGITRLPALPTRVVGALVGVEGALLLVGAAAKNTDTGDIYLLETQTKITAASLIGCRISIPTVQNESEFSITINGGEFSFMSDTAATVNEIVLGLIDALEYPEIISAEADGDEVVIRAVDLSAPFSCALSANLAFSELATPGPFAALNTGPKILPVGALDAIVTPVAGWRSVTNYVEGTIGRAIETDVAFRARRRRSVSFTATATVNAILSGLLDLEEVISAVVLENNDDVTDENGIPPHAVWAIVLGGDDEDVADVLFNRVAGGIGTFGDETVEVTAAGGQTYEMNFSRPDDINVYIEMTLSKSEDYPGEGDDLIKEAIVRYVNENVLIGGALIYSRLYSPINSIPGHAVDSLYIGTSPSPAGQISLTANVDEILRVDASRITINEA